jgi:hypothetical protein
VRRRGGRKRALGTRAPMMLPQGPNERWSLDFATGTLTDGRRFRSTEQRNTITIGVAVHLGCIFDRREVGAHVWTAPSMQGVSEVLCARSGALMCPACLTRSA